MTMNKMIVANLTHRPLRSMISISAVALEVTLILLIVSFFYGQLNGSKASQAGVGADVMVQPPGSSALVGVTGAPMPVKVGDKLRQLPHILVAAPVIWELTTKPTLEIIYGIDMASYNSISPAFRFLSGGSFGNPYDVIVDDYFAGTKKAKVGDVVEILDHQFHICGIVEHGKGARKFIPLATMQDLIGAPDHASVFYLKLDNPDNADAVVNEVKQVPGMENYSVRSMQEYMSMMTPENLPGFQTSIRIVVAISMIIGFLVIFQAMYTAVMERTREIGILKSLGASKLYIVNVVLRETALLAVAGIVAGTLISLIARRVILIEKPTLRLFWSYEWVVRATIIALTGALLGALYPAFKAADKDPIEALAYE
ncbi:MAG: FtsX-like permease family protein [Candidatus Sulfotelmatobacter sp.]